MPAFRQPGELGEGAAHLDPTSFLLNPCEGRGRFLHCALPRRDSPGNKGVAFCGKCTTRRLARCHAEPGLFYSSVRARWLMASRSAVQRDCRGGNPVERRTHLVQRAVRRQIRALLGKLLAKTPWRTR